MVGSSDSYTVLKSKLENLPENVVLIGSHTQMDSRKEKVEIYTFDSWIFCNFRVLILMFGILIWLKPCLQTKIL